MQHSLHFASAVFAGLLTVAAVNHSDATEVAPDNTAANKADQHTQATTPMDQSNDQEAIEVTASIRRAVLNDKSLSTAAHNVKIVTNGNTVTLRGPVESAAEKQRVESLAVKSAPGKTVHNQLAISE
jgi:hyperosmotically inducible periplasmic protein